MIRRDFLSITALGILGSSLPLFATQQPKFSKNELMGKVNPTLQREGYKLRKKAFLAFSRMKAEAAKNGFKIKAVSSYRNYDHQSRIWENKYKKFTASGMSPTKAIDKIIQYSTIPGTSRHHWGTDIDIVDGSVKPPKGGLLLAKNFEPGGPYYKFKLWMDEYANSFDFHLVYTNAKNRKGFKYEPWHYSYAPISKPMLQAFLKEDIIKGLKFTKLSGSEYFSDDFIRRYTQENILDINPNLL